MLTRTEPRVGQSGDERPDLQYAFVAGLFIAALLTPIAILAVSYIISDGAILYLGFLAVFTLITALASWFVSRISGVAVRLGRYNMIWLFVVVPFVPFVGVLVAPAIGIRPPDAAVLLAMILMLSGMFLSFALVTMSRNWYTATVLANTTEIAQWEARWPQQWRRFAVGVMILAVTSSIVGLIAQIGFGVDWAGNLYWLLFLWTPLAGAANPRTFRVTDPGLIIERPLFRRFRSWTVFEAYTLTESALVLHSTAWWRPNLRCDRADIENVDAVVAALDSVFADRTSSS